MKKEIIITVILLILCSTGNSQELFRKGVWGTYTWGNPWDDGDFTENSYPYIKGAPIVLRWSNLEPEPGNYQFEQLIGSKLKHANQDYIFKEIRKKRPGLSMRKY